jgi:23S rRNA (adenine2030-N6)-methyltransferase
MNYRHAFHAGNFADVVKHVALSLALAHLGRKDTPFFCLDAHAGLGAYDLDSVAAGKTGEYLAGIARVLDAPAPPLELAPYLAIIEHLNQGGPLRRYPGSPALMQAMTRPQDRVALVELHPEDASSLGAFAAGDRRISVHHTDAYAAMKALLPPPERRGLVLVDPPFELKDEFDRLRRGLRQALRRWATGCYMVWYPIKARPPVARFHQELLAEGLPKTLVAELLIRRDDDPFRLNGCGLVVINPPWPLHEAMAAVLPWLAGVLAPGTGSHRLEWLSGEEP